MWISLISAHFILFWICFADCMGFFLRISTTRLHTLWCSVFAKLPKKFLDDRAIILAEFDRVHHVFFLDFMIASVFECREN